ncbi:ABC transporter ATP-binding protein [Halobacteriovorax sp. HLS]|uniref:ABC transporter ATP-binding protein n=1 Tax=Halobacteriovorax sp. HLS TaxID=2234000 RepID=UPI000FDC1932|nr:ABC transporter ATP-binding protein [Halobacteriovorax sp. HLS]
MTFLKVDNIFKSYDTKSIAVVDHISFEVKKNEIISIIGPSGTGKSTIVKIIAGLLEFEKGEVTFLDKRLVSTQEKNTDLLKKISYVPQELSLDSTLSVFQNIGKNLDEENEEKRHHRIRDMIEVFGLQYKDEKFPHELSTGQKGRVEMAKALVTQPRLLILDEPFANLDKVLRNELKEELVEILRERSISALIVTHDLEDAFSHSDKILVLNEGRVKQFSTARDIYLKPVDAWVAKFSGSVNLMAGKIIDKTDEHFIHENKLGIFPILNVESGLRVGDFAYMLIRPENVHIDQQSPLRGKIKRLTHLGAFHEAWLQVGGIEKFRMIVANSEVSSLKKSISFTVDASQSSLIKI